MWKDCKRTEWIEREKESAVIGEPVHSISIHFQLYHQPRLNLSTVDGWKKRGKYT